MTLPLHEVKIALRDSFSLQDNIRRVLGLWVGGLSERNAKTADHQLSYSHQNLEKTLWSISCKFNHTKVLQKCYLNKTMSIVKQVWGLRNRSQNLVGLCYPIHLTALSCFFWFPSVQSGSTRNEVWGRRWRWWCYLWSDNMPTRVGQVVLWQHIHALASHWQRAVTVNRDCAER
jgi:hypothetical protein